MEMNLKAEVYVTSDLSHCPNTDNKKEANFVSNNIIKT